MNLTEIKSFLESALLAAGRPMNIDQLKGLFDVDSAPEKSQLRQALASLGDEYSDRGIEIGEVASGFRIQVKASMAERLHRLWEDRPPRYSRALFETLALIAYRQPITRGEIEEVRGVSVSSNIVRSLTEREWIRVIGHRDVPGRPALFGTTKGFLDYFGLKKLDDLPPLADLSDWESLRVQLNLPEVEADEVVTEAADVTVLAALPLETDLGQVESEPAATLDEHAADHDIPVLHPESVDAAEHGLDAEVAAKGEASVLQSENDFEDIVATQWPDPSGTIVPGSNHKGKSTR